MILNLIDKFLRMFHTDTKGERLGLKKPAATGKKFVDVACRMSRGQHHGIPLNAISIGSNHTLHSPILDDKTCYTGIEVVFSAMLNNCFTHTRDDGRQTVGTNMGVDINHDVGVGTMFNKESQHFGDIATFGRTRVKLTVAIGPCPTLAKTPVAIRIHLFDSHQIDYIFLPFFHRLPSLHNDGSNSQLQRPQSRKQSRRTSTHNDYRLRVFRILKISSAIKVFPVHITHLYHAVIQNIATTTVDTAASDTKRGGCAFLRAQSTRHSTPHSNLGGIFLGS